MENNVLQVGLKKLNLPCNKIIIDKFTRYINEIILFNNIHSFVATSNFNEIALNHVLDSLLATLVIKDIAKSFNETKIPNNFNNPNALSHCDSSIPTSFDIYNTYKLKIADVGSGAGLPGVPLAIIFPNVQFTLIEKSVKRCNFLENVVAILSLPNVTVCNNTVEKFIKNNSNNNLNNPNGFNGFDIITFRAVTALSKDWVDTLFSLLKPGGFVIAYKGKKSEIDKEIENLPYNKNNKITIKNISNSDLNKSERHLVIIKK